MSSITGFGIVLIIFGLAFVAVGGIDLSNIEEEKQNQAKAITVGGWLAISTGAIIISINAARGWGYNAKNEIKEGGKQDD